MRENIIGLSINLNNTTLELRDRFILIDNKISNKLKCYQFRLRWVMIKISHSWDSNLKSIVESNVFNTDEKKIAEEKLESDKKKFNFSAIATTTFIAVTILCGIATSWIGLGLTINFVCVTLYYKYKLWNSNLALNTAKEIEQKIYTLISNSIEKHRLQRLEIIEQVIQKENRNSLNEMKKFVTQIVSKYDTGDYFNLQTAPEDIAGGKSNQPLFGIDQQDFNRTSYRIKRASAKEWDGCPSDEPYWKEFINTCLSYSQKVEDQLAVKIENGRNIFYLAK